MREGRRELRILVWGEEGGKKKKIDFLIGLLSDNPQGQVKDTPEWRF